MRTRRLRQELERLYVEDYSTFLRVAIAIVGEEHGARDAVQDGFANALRSARTFLDGDVRAWTWRIVVNAALAVRRRRAIVAELEADPAAPDASAFDESGVRAWVAGLPERQRLAVFLRYYADLDYRSIAVALGVEVGTVSATLSQAHTALRRQLEEVRP